MSNPKRSLIMAGGGVKVAFQAGVLQVWLDEAGVEFAHADGASGGVFNLAMWCQGQSGTQIANAWRRHSPLRALHINPAIVRGVSIFTYKKMRRRVFPQWGLDWDRICSTDREATFSLYDFTHQQIEARVAADMNEDLLVAAVSLPMWFPPVRHQGRTYIDAVYATDGNLMEAVRRGADELWVIWTVSRKGRWHNGFVHQYFQILEASANSRLARDLASIEANNAAVAKNGPGSGEFGRHIEVRLLEAEVPLHYLINFRRKHFRSAVDMGVASARRWCDDNEVKLQSTNGRKNAGSQGLCFTETMAGHFAMGTDDPERGVALGSQHRSKLAFQLTIDIDDIDRFMAAPDLEATATGKVICDVLGGDLRVTKGNFNLLVDQSEQDCKHMRYLLWFNDLSGRPLTLAGHKIVRNNRGFDIWADTTTLRCRIYSGSVSWSEIDAVETAPQAIAAGVLRLTILKFLRQLTTFRFQRPTVLVRFAMRFGHELWKIYRPRRHAS